MSLFNSFAKMIDEMPMKGVFGALELERRMIQDDFAKKRTMPIEEAHSILSFCQFIDAAKQGSHILPMALPILHVTFYREMVHRLIDAELLPLRAGRQFESVFSHDLYQDAA